VTSIEIARSNGHGPEVPYDLEAPYKAALRRLPDVLAAMAVREWDGSFVRVAAAALTAAKGHATLAQVILDLEPSQLSEFSAWLSER
jgi:hypothetical protein